MTHLSTIVAIFACPTLRLIRSLRRLRHRRRRQRHEKWTKNDLERKEKKIKKKILNGSRGKHTTYASLIFSSRLQTMMCRLASTMMTRQQQQQQQRCLSFVRSHSAAATMDRAERIRQTLATALKPTVLDIVDISGKYNKNKKQRERLNIVYRRMWTIVSCACAFGRISRQITCEATPSGEHVAERRNSGNSRASARDQVVVDRRVSFQRGARRAQQ